MPPAGHIFDKSNLFKAAFVEGHLATISATLFLILTIAEISNID